MSSGRPACGSGIRRTSRFGQYGGSSQRSSPVMCTSTISSTRMSPSAIAEDRSNALRGTSMFMTASFTVCASVATPLHNAVMCATICSVTRTRTSQGSNMDDSLPELGDLEREVMQLVWAHGPVTAEVVRERLSRRLKESTVRTVLRRLEEKGYARHTVDGRTYVYHAAEPRARVAAKAVQRVVDWFCNGSIEEVLVGMVDNAMLDQKQVRMLADKVAQSKAKGVKK